MRYELLVLAEEDDDFQSIPLPAEGSLTIGRAEDGDVRLDDPAVSRRHAVLHVGETLAFEDLGSGNGTRVLDRRALASRTSSTDTADAFEHRIAPGSRVPIAPGTVVQIGATVLVVRQVPAVATGAGTTASPEAPRFIVADPRMRELEKLAARLARGTLPVLVIGETGVGKEVVAEAIHRASPRSRGPLLRLNCGAFTESLLESEIFGHERGAFTGATSAKPGLLETASGGTVFLDEIGELPLSLQTKLLRVLEESAVRRVGGLRAIPLEVRFISATHRDLSHDVGAGRFRQDLYYRINGATLHVPPLRERVADIEPLADYFARRAAERSGRVAPRIAKAALEWLRSQSWPGNVRELKHCVERAVLLAEAEIEREHVAFSAERPPLDAAPSFAPPSAAPGAAGPASSPAGLSPEQLSEMLHQAERDRIARALESCGGNQTRAAAELGISRRTLLYRMDQYDLPRPRKPRSE